MSKPYTQEEKRVELDRYIEMWRARSPPSGKELQKCVKLVTEIDQDEFEGTLAPVINIALRRSTDISVLAHLVHRAYQLSWGVVAVKYFDGICGSLVDMLGNAKLDVAYTAQLILLSIIEKSSSERSNLMKLLVKEIKGRWSILPVVVVAMLSASANVLTGIDDVSVIKNILDLIVPVARTSNDPLARVTCLAGYIAFTKYFTTELDTMQRDIVKECLASTTPSMRIVTLKLLLLLTEGAKSDCTPLLMHPVEMKPVKMYNTHSMVMGGLVTFARQSTPVDGDSGLVFQNILNALYIPVVPSPTLLSDIISMLTNADLDSKKIKQNVMDDLISIISNGLDASASNASVQHTKRVEAAAASAVVLRVIKSLSLPLPPAVLRVLSPSSLLMSDAVIARCSDEDIYSIVSYIHAVYSCGDVAHAAAANVDLKTLIPDSKDYHFAPFFDEFVKYAFETSNFSNKSVVFGAVSAMTKLHLKDLFTKDTLNGASRKSDIKSPVTFVKYALHRIKTADPLVNVSILMVMLQTLNERYSPVGPETLISDRIADRHVLNSAGNAAVGMIKDIIDTESSVHVSSLTLLILHHPGLMVADRVRGIHDNPNVYETESVSAAYERVGLMSASDVWNSLPECVSVVLLGINSKNTCISKHAKHLLSSLLVHGDAAVITSTLQQLIKTVWTDAINAIAVRPEHVTIWAGGADDVVNVDAYKAKTVEDKYNVKGRKDDDLEWSKLQEEAAKKSNKTAPKNEPKKTLTPKELAYRKEVLAGQALVRSTVQSVIDQVQCHLSALWYMYSHGVVLDQTLLKHSMLMLPPLRLLTCCSVPAVSSMASTAIYAAYDSYRIACRSTADPSLWRIIATVFMKSPYVMAQCWACECKASTDTVLPWTTVDDKPCLRNSVGNALIAIINDSKHKTEDAALSTSINDAVCLSLVHAMYCYVKDERDYASDVIKAISTAIGVHAGVLSSATGSRSQHSLMPYHIDQSQTDVLSWLFCQMMLYMYSTMPLPMRPTVHKVMTSSLYEASADSVPIDAVLDSVNDRDEHNCNKATWSGVDKNRLIGTLYITCFDAESTTVRAAARSLYNDLSNDCNSPSLDDGFYKHYISFMTNSTPYVKATLPKAFGGAAVTVKNNKWLLELFNYFSLPSSLVPNANKVNVSTLYNLMTAHDDLNNRAHGGDIYYEAYPNDFTYASSLKAVLTAAPTVCRSADNVSDVLLAPIPGTPPVVPRLRDMPEFSIQIEYIALILTEVSYVLVERDVEPVYKFILNEGISNNNASVRDAMVSAGLTIIRVHSGTTTTTEISRDDDGFVTPRDSFISTGCKTIGNEVFVSKLSPLFKSSMQAAPPPSSSRTVDRSVEYRRQGTAILMGGLAACLPSTDPMVQQVLGQLTDALDTSELGVQRCISDCFGTLAKNLSQDEQRTFLNKLISIMEKHQSKYARRGAALGVAGVIKGIGLGVLKKYEVLEKLTSMLELPFDGARESVMLCFEYLSRNFGAGFEPYVIQLLPHMLQGYSDSSPDVRTASESAANQIMSNLTGPGVRLILVPLLKAVDSDQWRTKSGAVVLLGSMSHCAPKQLGACLPQIVPKLVEVLADSHSKVEEAGRVALREIIDVIKNPEIQVIGSQLIKGLENPSVHLGAALDSLLNTTFVHVIDAPSLALIAPILQHGLVDRSADNKKKASQIASQLCGLTNPRDLLPYITQLEPHLRSLLYHTLPEIRTSASKALGTLVKQFGEAPFKDLVAWLINGLKSESSTTERMGAAQGLSEVLASLGNEYLSHIMPDIISNTLHAQTHIREGFIGLFVFLPDAYGAEFTPYVVDVFPSLLKGLADESEPVRNASMKAASGLVRKFSTLGVLALIPNFERGMFDPNWRIRVASVQLLGDFLYRVAGTTGKIQLDVSNDDDIDSIGTEAQAQNITVTLGQATRNRVYATLYMCRSDAQQVVRQEALHVWKTVVPNTPKTLKEILPDLIGMIIESLASTSADRRSTASKSLGDLVKRLHEKVLTDILPVLSDGLNSENPTIREGVCLGLSEIIVSANRVQIQDNSELLVGAVRMALCDSNDMVREAAARSFNVLFEAIGKTAVEQVVPPVLDLLERSDEIAEYALDGVRQLLVVSATVVLPLLIPRLLCAPVTAGHILALGSLAKVSGPFFHPHLKSTLETLRNIYADGPKDVSDACLTASGHVASQVSLASLGSFLMSISEGLKHDNPKIRSASGLQLTSFLERLVTSPSSSTGATASGGPRIDIDDRLDDVIHMCMTLYADSESYEAGVCAMVAAEPLIKKEAAYKFVEPLRSSLRLVSQDKCAKDETWTLPACKHPNALSTVLYILQNALTYGSPESREEAALAMSDFVKLTKKSEFQAYSRKFIGPAIKAASERLPPTAKVALFNAIIDIMAASPDTAKVFMSPLGNTCAKALAIPHPLVRARAAYGLAQLANITPRISPLYSEVFGVMDKNADAGTKEACINAVAGIMANTTAPTDDKTLERMMKLALECLGDEDPALREAAAQLAGRGIRLWPGTTVSDVLLGTSSTLTPALRHGTMGNHPYINRGGDVIKAMLSDINDDKSFVRLAAITAFKAVVLTYQSYEIDIIKSLVPEVGKRLRDESTDNRLTACSAIKILAKRLPELATTFENLHVVVPNLLMCAKEKNIPVKIASERALYYCLDAQHASTSTSIVSNYVKTEKDEGVAKGVAEYYKRVLSHMNDDDTGDDEMMQMNYEMQ